MIDIDPDGTGLPGIEQLRVIVGAVMTVGLIRSVLAMIISAFVWGFGANSSNPHLAARGKLGVLIGLRVQIVAHHFGLIAQSCGACHPQREASPTRFWRGNASAVVGPFA